MKSNLWLVAGVFSLVACVLLAEDKKSDDKEPPLPPGTIPFTIKASDPEGGTLKFDWKVVIGPDSARLDVRKTTFDEKAKKYHASAWFTPKEPGEYVIQATVTNDGGVSSTREWYQKVEADKASTPKGSEKENLRFNLSGDNARKVAATKLVDWRQIEGPKMEMGSDGKWKPNVPGRYVFQVTMTNDSGEKVTRTFVQEVKSARQ